jgi:hypothetical protein
MEAFMESRKKVLAVSQKNKSLAVKGKAGPNRSDLIESSIDDPETRRQIAVKAYELFEKRGCSHGRDFDDWLDAEKLVLSELKSA